MTRLRTWLGWCALLVVGARVHADTGLNAANTRIATNRLETVVLPAPTQLLAFNDPKACAAYGGLAGGLACQALLPKGGLALTWKYPRRQIDSYRAYQVPNPRARYTPNSPMRLRGTQTPIETQSAVIEDRSVARLIVLAPRPAGFEDTCFAVTAVVGDRESPMSEPFCVGAGATVQNVSLPPAHALMMRVGYQWNPMEEKIFNPDAETYEARFDPWQHGQSFSVGHSRQDILFRPDHTVSGTSVSVARGYLFFDVTPLSNAKINGAKLHFAVDSNGGDSGSCLTEINDPGQNWVSARSALWSRGRPLMTAQSYAGAAFDIDITSIARGWAAGGPNNGVELVGDAWPGVNYQLKNITDSCTTSLSNVTLEVAYIK